jgi:hypothetical protein
MASFHPSRRSSVISSVIAAGFVLGFAGGAVEAFTVSLQKLRTVSAPGGAGTADSNVNVNENVQENIQENTAAQAEQTIDQAEQITEQIIDSDRFESFDYGMFQSQENAVEVLKLLPPAEQELVGLIGENFIK